MTSTKTRQRRSIGVLLAVAACTVPGPAAWADIGPPVTKPREEWSVSVSEFQENLREIVDGFVGVVYAFTQPIDMRVSEMLTGVRATMAIKLYGDDLKVMEKKSKQIEELVSEVPGAVDVFREPLSGQV